MPDLDFAGFFYHSRDIGFITDARGAILAVTHGTERALGHTRMELAGLDLPHLSAGADLRPFFAVGDPPRSRVHVEFQLRTKSGRVLVVDAWASCLRDASGRHVGWFFAGQDLRGSLAEARGSRTILDALVDSIGAALWSFDRNGVVATWSRACESYFGYTRAEAEGKLSAVRLFSSPDEFRRALRSVDETGQFSGDTALVGREGQLRPNQLSVTRLTASDGQPIGYTCVSFDVGEHKRAEEFQRVLFEQAGEAIFVVDPETKRVLDCNAKAYEVHGYTREEMLALRSPDFHPPDEDPARLPGIYRQLDETGRYESDREFHRRKDGSVFPCELNIRRVTVGGRRFSIVVLRDLTERRRAEEYFRVLFEKANSGILMADCQDLRVMAANEKACETLGWARDELMGMPLLSLHPDFDQEAARKVAEEVQARGEGHYDRLWLLRRDGTAFPIDLSVRRVTLGERPYFLGVFQDITDRVRTAKQLEEAKAFLEKRVGERTAELRESEARYRALAKNAGVGVWQITPEGYTIYINPEMCSILGISGPEELAGKTFHPLFTAESLEAIKKEHARRREGVASSYEVEVVHKDGTRRQVVIYGAPMRSPDGTLRSLIGTFIDITERKRSDEALRRAHGELERRVEERTAELARANLLLKEEIAERKRTEEDLKLFRRIFAHASEGICILGPEGRVLAQNAAHRELLGYPDEELVGKTPTALSGDFERVLRALQETGRFEGEAVFRTRKGDLLNVELSAFTMRNASGGVLCHVAIKRDITERKRAEEELRFQKTLLESQSEAGIDGILVVDDQGKMISFNRRFVKMWAIPPDVVESRSDEAALASVRDKVVDWGGFISKVRYLYDHPDEESRDELALKDGRVFDRYSAPVRSADGTSYGRVWFFRDVTGRKRTELELRRAAEETRRAYRDRKQTQAQLIRSEKLASIGMLVSGVGHEINNPLNVMYGNLQLLAKAWEETGLPSAASAKGGALGKPGSRDGKDAVPRRLRKIRGMIRDALKAAGQARRIVEDFRSFARDTRTAEPVDLNVCLEETVSLLQRELPPRVRLVKKLRPLPPVRCFRGQMGQVFLNLLKNAAEAIEERGTITLRTQRRDSHVIIEVADTGRGMPEEVRSKLFEPFFTTKPIGKGLGLGLSISAMIVQNHGGQISARSRPGHGSIFRIELPIKS